MADISIAHQHGLSLDEAKEKTNQIVTDVQDEFPDLINTIEWNGDKTRADVKAFQRKGSGKDPEQDRQVLCLSVRRFPGLEY